MQLALVNNERTEAFPGGRGICPQCKADTIAKCGTRIIHHWAHAQNKNCDPWWENETEWHRNWKNQFPMNWREVTHIANDGEIHRADIKTKSGLIIEFQHSNISDQERISREEFYKNIIWVIDGNPFKKSFDIYHYLPDPTSDIAKDIAWSKAKRHMKGANSGIFFRLSEARESHPEITKKDLSFGTLHSLYEIEEEIKESYIGHHQYDWVRPREAWIETKSPVFIDFGDTYLVHLQIYDESGLNCIRKVPKKKFIRMVLERSNLEEFT
jgi:competence protein CoiA